MEQKKPVDMEVEASWYDDDDDHNDKEENDADDMKKRNLNEENYENEEEEEEEDQENNTTNTKQESSTDPKRHAKDLRKEQQQKLQEQRESFIMRNLRELYKTKVLPIERKYHMYSFLLPTGGPIQDAEFDARPMVLLLGQYSTGKTSFIRYILGNVNFPGMHIGPEPTTDKFMALVHGEASPDCTDTDDSLSYDYGGNDSETSFDKIETSDNDLNSLHAKGKIIKGNSLTVTPELPFSSLSTFGTSFLNHFQGSICPAPLLKRVTLIDTPGVLSGEKQRLARAYDFAEVAKWFADRSDLILLLFDSHKLDISDELKEIINKIRPNNDDKIRCVLNKADGVQREQFVRVYGSLMWSMGKIFQTPEVLRVYTGSYWDRELRCKDFQKMFMADERLLLEELTSLPSSAVERKVNEIVKRIRLVKVHLCILATIRKKMPYFFGSRATKQHILQNLDSIFDHVRSLYSLSLGDMPDEEAFREKLTHFGDFYKLPKMDTNMLLQLDNLIQEDIPQLMRGAARLTETKTVSLDLDHRYRKKSSSKLHKKTTTIKHSAKKTNHIMKSTTRSHSDTFAIKSSSLGPKKKVRANIHVQNGISTPSNIQFQQHP